MLQLNTLIQERDKLSLKLNSMTVKELKQFALDNSLELRASSKDRAKQSILHQMYQYKINHLSIVNS